MPAQNLTPIRIITVPLALRSSGDTAAFTEAAERNVQDMHKMGTDINEKLIPAINAAVDPLNTLVDNLPAVQNAAANANTAIQKAAAAATSATAAADSAGTASTKAGEAAASATGANIAKAGAETAKTEAQTAKTGAESAKTEANTAKTGAEAAKTEAQTAKTGAERAKTEAETAKTAAQTAETNANASKNAAAGSATAAAGSATAANTAKTGAEAAKVAAAESAKQAADVIVNQIPVASETMLGGIKIGEDLTIDPVTKKATVRVRTSYVTIYISKTGNDANDGFSEAKAVFTVNRAMDIGAGLRVSRNASIILSFGAGDWGTLALYGGIFSAGTIIITSSTKVIGNTENLARFLNIHAQCGRYVVDNVESEMIQASELTYLYFRKYVRFCRVVALFNSAIAMEATVYDIYKKSDGGHSIFQSYLGGTIYVGNAGTVFNFEEDCACGNGTASVFLCGEINFTAPSVLFTGAPQSGKNFLSVQNGAINITGTISKTFFPGNGTYTLNTGGSYCGERAEDAKPTIIDGVGKWRSISGVPPIALPAGGTWAYNLIKSTAAGAVTDTLAGVAAGGATLVASGTDKYNGFAWRTV